MEVSGTFSQILDRENDFQRVLFVIELSPTILNL